MCVPANIHKMCEYVGKPQYCGTSKRDLAEGRALRKNTSFSGRLACNTARTNNPASDFILRLWYDFCKVFAFSWCLCLFFDLDARSREAVFEELRGM